MGATLRFILVVMIVLGTASGALADQQQSPTLTVIGQGEISAAAEKGVVRLGAAAQSEKAADAVDQVNRAVQGILKGVRSMGIPDEKIATVEISIAPVYGNHPQGPSERGREPVIVGYRASNVVRVEVEDLKILGRVIDAGLGAGANRVEGISFGLKNEKEYRRRSLTLAAEDAKGKAETIAKAMGVQLLKVRSVSEAVDLIRPHVESGLRMAAAPVPVEPGQLEVRGSITVTYDIAEPAAR